MIAVHPQSRAWNSRISTSRASPGWAPLTNTGPETGLTRWKSSAATSALVESGPSCWSEASRTVKATSVPDSISSAGSRSRSHAWWNASSRTSWMEWPCIPARYPPARMSDRASDLRDHEHDGQDRQGDPSGREHGDGAKANWQVTAGRERLLELALALRADEQEPDRE